MTWGEFKKMLEDKGVTDDMTIDYIDVSAYSHDATVDFEGDHVAIWD